jgi:hypothetical protein
LQLRIASIANWLSASAILRAVRLDRIGVVEFSGITFSSVANEAPSNTAKDPDQWVSGGDPMTGAQASYIATLAEQAHEH